jgi:hypothetical protein
MALTEDPEALWQFATERIDADVPVMSEHLDGGLLVAYRCIEGRRQLFFDGTVRPGWIDGTAFQPHAVYSFVRERDPLSKQEIVRAALRRAWDRGRRHVHDGVPQGLAGLHAYQADIGDPERSFQEAQEWLCWAALQRLMARRCSEVWLRTVAAEVPDASPFLRAAAQCYGKAFRHYRRFRQELGASASRGQPDSRVPERSPAAVRALGRGIEAEAAGLAALEEAVEQLD